jgi:hypothetical protein
MTTESSILFNMLHYVLNRGEEEEEEKKVTRVHFKPRKRKKE